VRKRKGIAIRPLVAATAAGLGLAVAVGAFVPAMRNQNPLRPEEKAAIQAGAEAGDHAAQRTLAEINTDWANEKPDYVAALSWYEKAADGSENTEDSARMNALRQFNADHARLYEKAQGGDSQDLLTFAWHTPHMASGVAGDAPFAHWLLLAARAGSDKAQAQIGYLYLRAYYVRHSGRHNDTEAAREKSLGWKFGDFSRPIKLDEPIGFDDESLQTDISNAIYWLRKAAARGDALSQYNLGLAYAISGPTRDLEAASLWLHRALFLDPTLPVTACDLDLKGRIIAGPVDESGATPDVTAAFRCYNRVTTQHPGTYYVLGYMYHRGIGIGRDDRLALSWLRKAEAAPYWRPAAWHEIALLYGDSRIVGRDPVASVVLLAKSQRLAYAPVSCGPEQSNDKGGPAFKPGYDEIDRQEELVKSYTALTSPQRQEVKKQLAKLGIQPPLLVGQPRMPLFREVVPCD